MLILFFSSFKNIIKSNLLFLFFMWKFQIIQTADSIIAVFLYSKLSKQEKISGILLFYMAWQNVHYYRRSCTTPTQLKGYHFTNVAQNVRHLGAD